ncbi:hypothetical protein ANCDUO_14489 [Ancylostoma duodenale]|uniref:Uncharacterized protein n=1 Tax=Ancylostoma duodenale TaxID=51022 RepID=A0A0C2G3C6_9BILA|nr:hypothetical protein ANCDUO_14489 [Ancylostoma duodenale]
MGVATKAGASFSGRNQTTPGIRSVQTGGVSSLFNSPFRVIGKRNQMYGLYRNADFDFRPIPLSPDQIDY